MFNSLFWYPNPAINKYELPKAPIIYTMLTINHLSIIKNTMKNPTVILVGLLGFHSEPIDMKICVLSFGSVQ
jgi:hypothetical protein